MNIYTDPHGTQTPPRIVQPTPASRLEVCSVGNAFPGGGICLDSAPCSDAEAGCPSIPAEAAIPTQDVQQKAVGLGYLLGLTWGYPSLFAQAIQQSHDHVQKQEQCGHILMTLIVVWTTKGWCPFSKVMNNNSPYKVCRNG